jgi:hypothetical protein
MDWWRKFLKLLKDWGWDIALGIVAMLLMWQGAMILKALHF